MVCPILFPPARKGPTATYILVHLASYPKYYNATYKCSHFHKIYHRFNLTIDFTGILISCNVTEAFTMDDAWVHRSQNPWFSCVVFILRSHLTPLDGDLF
jgi:hypothetical protein